MNLPDNCHLIGEIKYHCDQEGFVLYHAPSVLVHNVPTTILYETCTENDGTAQVWEDPLGTNRYVVGKTVIKNIIV